MEIKKSPKADLQNKRGLLLEIGLVVALALVIAAFAYTPKEHRIEKVDLNYGPVEEEITEITRQDQKPPEPPKKVEVKVIADLLQVVTNDTKITTEVDFAEFDENTEVIQQVDVVEETIEDDQPFLIAETMPSFQGGDLNTFRGMKSVIFDLDLTLVDTTNLESLRHNRNWQEAYRRISETVMYDGMTEVLEVIRKHHIPCAIVSTSPRPYVEKIVAHYNLPVQHIVSYHDAKPIKPHPAQMLKALDLMGVSAKDAISFGDRVIDIEASNAAGIESVACFWGTKEKGELLHSGYSHAIVKPNEILTLIR